MPHAGYRYCIGTSMHAFQSVNMSNYDRVFVIGPAHRFRLRACRIPDATEAETPYVPLPFDLETVSLLQSRHPSLFVPISVNLAELEHSVEMQFPLLKFMADKAEHIPKIVPVVVGHLLASDRTHIGNILREFGQDSQTLFVISSDFCHWGQDFDFTEIPDGAGKIYERIERLDLEAADIISSGNVSAFTDYLDRTRNTICGQEPIILMMLSLPDVKGEFPAYSQSKNVTNQWGTVLSHAFQQLNIKIGSHQTFEPTHPHH